MLNCLKTNLEHHNIVCLSILEEQGTIRRLKCHPLSHFKENKTEQSISHFWNQKDPLSYLVLILKNLILQKRIFKLQLTCFKLPKFEKFENYGNTQHQNKT